MMREEKNPCENRVKATKFTDQNQIPRNNVKANSNYTKMKSSWGSNLVKGFSAADKKTKTRVLQTNVNNNNSNSTKPPLNGNVTNSRIKRSLIGDLSCSIYSTQVHPQGQNKVKPVGSSEDLFLEIDHLRNLLQESKDREGKLQGELSEYKRNPKVVELEREVELKRNEVEGLVKKVGLLEIEKENLCGQLVSLANVMGKCNDDGDGVLKREGGDHLSSVEVEVVELRRLNKELQLQKRNLACRVSTLESQLTTLAQVSEQSDIVDKIKAEASLLRHTNEDLGKQVEALQISRMNEVEELVYLRWVNSCLRDELRNFSTPTDDKRSSLSPLEQSRESICLSPFQIDEDSDDNTSNKMYLIKKFKRWPITEDDLQHLKYSDNIVSRNSDDRQGRRHSISGSNCCPEDLLTNKRRQSDGFMCSKEVDKGTEVLISQKYDLEVSRSPRIIDFHEIGKMTAIVDVEKRALRIPTAPPRPSCSSLSGKNDETSVQAMPPTLAPPPPPPPPPPVKLMSRSTVGKVQRAPQLVEFYHSLMKRDSRKECLNSGTTDASEVATVRSSMIGEIENRSSYLLAIKADVETQGEFVNSLIREVNDAVYQNIEDVVAFVKWLDDELGFLVDERAVLKHFDWPEKKADTLREAAFGYTDLKKLEQEVSNYKDDHRLPCDAALKKMAALSERMERIVYNIFRIRESLMRHCKEFHIPTEWMLDMGIISKIKFGSVKLAKLYMKRVAMEIQLKGTTDKDSSLDYMLLQGVRFAFRIHQFAGGFDAETMHAFEELRDLAIVLNKK